MKVLFEGHEYWIEFRHGFVYLSGFGKRETTTCIIRDASAPVGNDKNHPSVAEATVTRYHKDIYDKDKARKAALRQVLVEFEPLMASYWGKDWDKANCKAAYKLFWDVYLNRKSKSEGRT